MSGLTKLFSFEPSFVNVLFLVGAKLVIDGNCNKLFLQNISKKRRRNYETGPLRKEEKTGFPTGYSLTKAKTDGRLFIYKEQP